MEVSWWPALRRSLEFRQSNPTKEDCAALTKKIALTKQSTMHWMHKNRLHLTYEKDSIGQKQ